MASWTDLQICAALGAATGAVVLGTRRQPVPALAFGAMATAITYRALARRWAGHANGARANEHTRAALAGARGLHLRESVRLERPVEDVFRYWRHLENLPRFMRHVEHVSETSPGMSHWVVRGPAGLRVEWDAEIINEVPNRLIGWRSVPGSDVVTAGSVQFARVRGGRIDAGNGAPAIRAASRTRRRVAGDAVRAGALGHDARGPAAIQAVSGGRRVCDGHAFRD